MASNSGVQVQRLDDSDGGLGLLQVVIVRTDAECDNAVRMLRAPMVFTFVLIFLLVAVAHFSDAFMCLLSVVLYAMLARHAGEANFTLSQLNTAQHSAQFAHVSPFADSSECPLPTPASLPACLL